MKRAFRRKRRNAAGIAVCVTARRGNSYRIWLASHEDLAALGAKLGLKPIEL